jgi:hypothetical protein
MLKKLSSCKANYVHQLFSEQFTETASHELQNKHLPIVMVDKVVWEGVQF